jgi:rhamnulokinase
MGLWIVERCRELWAERGWMAQWAELLAGQDPDRPGEVFIDPDDLRFLAPQDMDQEVRAALREQGLSSDHSPRELTRIVLQSLARRYAAVVRELEDTIGRDIPGVHIVGGGCQNAFLNQATANACARPVLAGPVEATALGNLMLQAIGDGVFAKLESARAAVRAHTTPRWFLPRAVIG